MKIPECWRDQERRKVQWASKARLSFRTGLLKPIRANIWPPCALDAGHGSVGFNVCPAGFWSCFGPISPSMPLFLLFGMGMFTLCHCSWSMSFSFFFYRGLQPKSFALGLERELFNNAGTVKMMGTLKMD
jgi:hypothetical protein